VRHDSKFIALLSQQTGLSVEDIKAGLGELIEAGFMVRGAKGYIAALPKDEPPADQAEGSKISSATTPIGNDASQGGRDAE